MTLYIYYGKKYSAKDTTEEEIVTIPTQYIPQIVYSIERQKDKKDWISEEDWSQGYTDLCNVQWDMLMGGLSDLIESNRQIYRLLDSALNGAAYSTTGPLPADIVPAIPLVPANDVGEGPGLRRQLLDAQGVLPGGWFGLFDVPATTADVVQALRQGSEAQVTNLFDKLDLLGDATDVASLFNVVRGTLSDGLEAGAEGGILAVLVASTMANAAALGLQAAQLDSLISALQRIVASLDGGGLAPVDDVLTALRGSTPASSTRNAADLLEAIRLKTL